MIQCILNASSAAAAQTLVSGTQPGATSTEEGTEYTEWVALQRSIHIRHLPSQDRSHLTERRIEKEERLFVVEERHIDGMLYLRLADGRGWVFVTHDKHGVLCDRITTPISNKIKEMLHAVQIYMKRGDNARTLAGENAKSMQMLRKQAESNDATTLAGIETKTTFETFLKQKIIVF